MKPDVRWEQNRGDMLFRDDYGTIWKIRVIDHGHPRACPLEIICLEHHDPEPTCPRCGSERFEYIGDVQRCADCGQ